MLHSNLVLWQSYCYLSQHIEEYYNEVQNLRRDSVFGERLVYA
jgi:hypothetical protein